MSYINCGAYVNNKRPASKKALKEAIERSLVQEAEVWFDATAAFGPDAGLTYDLGSAFSEAGNKLSVVGPDPYTKRSWYATVETDRNGRVKVS